MTDTASPGPIAKVFSSTASDGAASDARFGANEPFTLVIFGASGDLAKRKLLPALFHLEEDGFLPDKFAIVGFSRSPLSDTAYRTSVTESLAEQKLTIGPKSKLVDSLYYVAGDNDDADSFVRLQQRIEQIERERGLAGNRLYYLSVAPQFFSTIVLRLAAHDMIRKRDDQTWSRVVIEKPFGRDLTSARELNRTITSVLSEPQIYRIDHYLGKETVQNLFSFRFGNSIFEPLFNQKYVDNVQITVAETLGMEGKRGAYYDGAGALRDMVENHLLQLLTIVAMEPPSSLDGTSLRDEKVKVLRAIEPMSQDAVAHCTVRGQYGAGSSQGQPINPYLRESGVKPDSRTETFVALKLFVDNWRWAGVPFYLRTGKRLKQRVSEIAVTFKPPPLHLYRQLCSPNDACEPMANVLLVRIQPDEGISLSFAAKSPGMQVRLDDVRMDFFYSAFGKRSPEAYERLLLDALRGDASLFTRSDETEYAWRFISSIHEGWASMKEPEVFSYAPFSDGPIEANRLFAGTNKSWRPLSEA